MPLTWSEPRDPNGECSYTHVVSETPLGVLRIEWKGWKETHSPTCDLPWGEFIIETSLDDCKARVQDAWNLTVRLAAALST